MIPVKGFSNLYRDENTGAIINCDSVEYEQYMSTINSRITQKHELESMKKEMSEIKTLLKELINGLKWNFFGWY